MHEEADGYIHLIAGIRNSALVTNSSGLCMSYAMPDEARSRAVQPADQSGNGVAELIG